MYAQTREKVSDVKSTAAASVFIATKECKCDRTIKEINKVVDPTRNLKNALGKASRELTKVMQERLQVRGPPAVLVTPVIHIHARHACRSGCRRGAPLPCSSRRSFPSAHAVHAEDTVLML